VSEIIKEYFAIAAIVFIFVFFILVVPLTVAEANKQACIETGMRGGYTASDIVSICGRR
jgi:hypothetical protein